jgi:predicted Zn-dependent peptidase
MEYQYFTLKNGIRVIHKPVAAKVAHCGVIINAGSRDELPPEAGMAHFIEHMLFKGTARRKAYHILSRLENVGGELNAYTGKEETFYYASFLDQHYDRTLELLSDILFNSTFPEKEIAKEKDVVLDEINSMKDTPNELIFDEFEELLFHGHSLGTCILGNELTLKSFTKKDIHAFIKRNYLTRQIVIASVGSIKPEKLIAKIEKYFGDATENSGHLSRVPFEEYQGRSKLEKKSKYQVHHMMGTEAYGVKSDKRTALGLLANILGGPGMNSRLNLGIREKYGYCYNIEAHYQPYSDTGNFNIYIGTDNGYLEKAVRLINKELKLLKDSSMGTLQLHRAKQQIIGQMAISLESNLSEMISIGKSHLFYDKVDSFADVAKKVESITAIELQEVANEIFDISNFTSLTFIPGE